MLCKMPANPRSWEFCGLLFSGILVAYTLRVNISVAAQQIRHDLNWTEDQKGLVLSSFYWGYALGQLPASYFAMHYGAKLIFGLSVFIPSVLTLLFPSAAQYNFVLALFVRMCIGLIEACCFPSVFHFFPHWIPEQDKTIMVACTLSGVYLGEMIAFFFSGMIISESNTIDGYEILGWRGAFYVFGVIGVLWFPFWMYTAHEKPADHPRITQEELDYIHRGYNHVASDEDDSLDYYGSKEVYHGSYNNEGRARLLSGTYGERLLSGDAGRVTSNSLNQPLISYLESNPILSSSSTGISSRHNSTSSHGQGQLAAAVLSPVGILSSAAAPVRQSHDVGDSSVPYENPFFLVPWRAIWTTPAVLTLFFASFTNGYICFLLLSEMPSYLTDELGFDLASAGYLCVAPYAALFLTSLGFGSVFYSLQIKYGWSTRTVRQVAQFLAFGGSSAALMVCGFVSNRWFAYSCLVIAQGLLGANQSGLSCCYLDICPTFSPQLNTIGNALSAVAGMIGPIIVSKLLTAFPGVWGWRSVFISTTLMSVIALIFWRRFQTSDIDARINSPISNTPSGDKKFSKVQK